MIRRGRFKNRYQGHTLWFANHELQEVNNSMTYSGLGKWGIYDPADQGVEDSGTTSRPASGVSTNQHHSGSRSMRTQITPGGGSAGCRTFMNQFTTPGMTLYHSAWYYYPTLLQATGYQLMQFKNRTALAVSDVAWKLAVKNPTVSTMRINLVFELGVNFGVLGPHAGEDNTGAAVFYEAPIDLPVATWFKITVYLKQSSLFSGQIIVWQDKRKIIQQSGIVTKVAGSTNSFSVTNYGQGTSPATVDQYIDDVFVGTRKV